MISCCRIAFNAINKQIKTLLVPEKGAYVRNPRETLKLLSSILTAEGSGFQSISITRQCESISFIAIDGLSRCIRLINYNILMLLLQGQSSRINVPHKALGSNRTPTNALSYPSSSRSRSNLGSIEISSILHSGTMSII
jgi:hypothetical protein